MRRLADDLVLSLKDQIRTFRYSLRSEAEMPGSALPEAYRNIDLGPLGAVGAMIGTPVLRMADDLFTQVENVTLGLLEDPSDRTVFPRPVTDYFGRSDAKASFTHDFYHEAKALLGQHGARHALVSEHAIEDLKKELHVRHQDLISSAASPTRVSTDAQAARVRVCAAIAIGFARVRPVQKVDLMAVAGAGQVRHLMIAPNLYVGLVLGLAVALVTVRAQAQDLDGSELIESADAVVDARFERLKAAVDSKDPVAALAREFEAVLPFLP